MEKPAHINSIRNFIRDGQRPEQYLDSVALWQARYEELQKEESKLRVRIMELEAMLEASTNTSIRTTQGAVMSTSHKARGGATVAHRKRKKGNTDLADTADDRVRKLARTSKNSQSPLANNFRPSVLNVGFDLEEDRPTNRLIGHMYSIHSAMKGVENESTKPEELKDIIKLSAADTGLVISSVQTLNAVHAAKPPRAHRPNVQTQEDGASVEPTQLIADTDMKCVAIARFFPLILKALATLPDTQSYRGEAIYALISIFKDLLERICSLSAFKAQRDLSNVASKTKPSRLLAEISDYLPEPMQMGSTTGEEDDKVIKKLCQLAFSMMDSLDPNNSEDKEIFEYFLYFLLSRIGELLKEFVFRHEALSITKDIQGDHQRAKQEAQAPYLIYLLRHATTVTGKQFGLDTPFHQTYNSPSLAQGQRKSVRSILSKARLILQNTLLKAMFGQQTEEFVQSLKAPLEKCANSCLDAGPSQIDGKLQTTSEWFKNEVWQTVGWDVLYDTIQFK